MSPDMVTAHQEIVLSDRKQQILQAAIEIIASKGYGNLTMRALARASGIKLGALQYHFRTWEDMLRALAAYITDAYQRSWETLHLSGEEASLKDLVHFIMDDPAGSTLSGNEFFPQLWAMAQVEPAMAEKLDELYEVYKERLEERLTALGIRAPAADALAIMSLLEGTMVFVGDDRRWANQRDAVHDAVRELLEARYGDWD
jgi:AcrR family transcriptional regulator